MVSLPSIEQKHDKFLWDFLNRFSESRLQTKNCLLDVLLVALVNSIQHIHFTLFMHAQANLFRPTPRVH